MTSTPRGKGVELIYKTRLKSWRPFQFTAHIGIPEDMHTRFGDEDEERKAAHLHASTSMAALAAERSPGASGSVSQFHCVASFRTDFDQQDQCYVFELVHSEQLGLVAARLSNRRIKLFSLRWGSTRDSTLRALRAAAAPGGGLAPLSHSPHRAHWLPCPACPCSPSGLQFVGELTGHQGPVTDARFDLPDQPHLLHSCSHDGSVLGWDTRSGQVVERYAAARAELLCCSTNGALVAAGAGDRVLFWDRRAQRPLASFDDTHAQDVTQVRFHPHHRSMLVTASEDGLLAVFDTAPQLGEWGAARGAWARGRLDQHERGRWCRWVW